MFRSLFVSSLTLASTFLLSVTASALHSRAIANCSADAIASPNIFGAEVTCLTATIYIDWQAIPGNDVCLAIVTITHPGANDTVNNWIALPLNNWNGVLQGIGGGGYSAGDITALGPQTLLGYAAAMTDAGHNTSDALTQTAEPWALSSTGNVNQGLILNFAHR